MIIYSTVLVVLIVQLSQCEGEYQPNWASLDSRPLPDWYDEAKVGIFLHWGVFSVPSFGSEWFWEEWKGRKVPAYVDFVKNNYRPSWTYADFAEQFTAEFFDPLHWADIFKASGAQYIVLTSKHHEGFTNWPSNVSYSWNSMAVGPKRDLVGDLAKAVRKSSDIHFGLYHSMYEWFNPLYLKDKANHFTSQDFVRTKTMPELYELVNTYKPEVIWSDGDWEAPYTYWNSTEFLAWLYNDSPVKDSVVVNDRWGSGMTCKHGGYFTCSDRYDPGVLQKHKWENAMTLDRLSWGFRRDATLDQYLTIEELTALLIRTVSCGGNLLINIGPTRDGTIVPIFEERLRQIGSWLSVNGAAIYSTKPWVYQNDTVNSYVWYTCKKSTVFAMSLVYPSQTLALGAVKTTPATKVTMLGYTAPVEWKASPSGKLEITVPQLSVSHMPSTYGWVFQLEGVEAA